MKLLAATSIALALGLAHPAAAAQEDAAPAASDRQSVALADSLAALATDKEMVTTQLPINFSATFIQALKNEGSYAMIERASPGIVQAMLDAVLPIYIASAAERLPELQAEIRDIYLSQLSFAEMSEVHAFYVSPLGMKFREIVMFANRDGSVTATAAGGLDASTDELADSLMTGIAAEMSGNVDKFSQDEMRALIVALKKPALKKMDDVGPLIVKAMIDWDKAMPLSVSAEINRRIEDVAAQRLGE